MSYAQLHKHCSEQRGRNGRGKLIPKVMELTGLSRPRIQISSRLDPRNLLGFIIFPTESDTQLTQFTRGAPLIVIAREIPEEWRRFVCIKELMHYFDQSVEKVGTADTFESLVTALTAPPVPLHERSPTVDSEGKAYWRALGVVCGEDMRQDCLRKRDSGEMTIEQIAEKLKIPASILPHLFDGNFQSTIKSLYDDD